jgi:hypothetical protein
VASSAGVRKEKGTAGGGGGGFQRLNSGSESESERWRWLYVRIFFFNKRKTAERRGAISYRGITAWQTMNKSAYQRISVILPLVKARRIFIVARHLIMQQKPWRRLRGGGGVALARRGAYRLLGMRDGVNAYNGVAASSALIIVGGVIFLAWQQRAAQKKPRRNSWRRRRSAMLCAIFISCSANIAHACRGRACALLLCWRALKVMDCAKAATSL